MAGHRHEFGVARPANLPFPINLGLHVICGAPFCLCDSLVPSFLLAALACVSLAVSQAFQDLDFAGLSPDLARDSREHHALSGHVPGHGLQPRVE
jgi:hypothetical protein